MLWDDLIDPVELTAEARDAAADADASEGSLARFLPNVEVSDIRVHVTQTENGLVEEANYRAWDAEPETAGGEQGGGFTIDLAALGQKRFITEYAQLRIRNASDEEYRAMLRRAARAAGQAVAARMERQRAIALLTGKTTITGRRYNSEDDFGRDPSHEVTFPESWANTSVSRLSDLESIVDRYVETNGVEPGTMLVPNRVLRALASGEEFATVLANGSTRRATIDEMRSIIAGAGLPNIETYNRRTSNGLLLPDDQLILLPAPGATTADSQTDFGASFWGRTLTSMEPDYSIEPVEQPGVVVAAHKNQSVPHNAWVESDAIGLPVLANANLSLVASVFG